MKIGIITIHYSSNYGAVLQAYALQKKLEKLGHNVEIIDYINPLSKERMKLFGGSVVDKIRTLMFLPKRIKRISSFKSFITNEMKLSSRKIYDLKEINSENFDYDLFITGSDQVFNFFLAEGREIMKTYFMPCVTDKKVSYASSMGDGVEKYDDEDKKWLKETLSQYKILSVREQKAADFIESMGLQKPEVVLDPTLLLDTTVWNEISTDTKFKENSYILFYSVLSDKWIVQRVEKISEKLGMPVIAPHLQNRFELGTNFIRAEECGPKEFISLIKNAGFVCTSSFHGTVFSILFKKKFLSFSMTQKGRIENILNKLKLSDLIVNEYDNIEEKIDNTKEIDFDLAHKILNKEREKSNSFILKMLED